MIMGRNCCLGRLSASLVGFGLLTGVGLARPASAQDAGLEASRACDAAGAVAERRYDVPAGLLRAIGRVESGRRDPATGQVAPWPWTINAEGRGHLFESRSDALAATQALQRSGVSSIDVGCFQVNLVHHPAAFPTLDDGFEPRSNADYAARFLVSLQVKTGSWEAAVGAYHSATPELGNPYRDRVLAGWSRDGQSTTPTPMPLPAAAAPQAFVVRVVTWSPPASASRAMRIWTPSVAGQGASIIRITRG
jgi:hypothetical protein